VLHQPSSGGQMGTGAGLLAVVAGMLGEIGPDAEQTAEPSSVRQSTTNAERRTFM
jgi:hypothetical protein